jgi:hypothetical protein
MGIKQERAAADAPASGSDVDITEDLDLQGSRAFYNAQARPSSIPKAAALLLLDWGMP